jgi:pimeloyl-ACP methyl ester carboxylesterase
MAQRPDQIGPSVLCATFARSPLATLTRMANYVPAQMFSIGALNEFYLDVYQIDDEDSSETQPLPLNITEQLDGALLKHRISVLSRIDVSALLPNIEIPILYLHALKDRIVSEIDAQMMQEYLPDINRIDIDAPHLLLQTRPQKCAELILKHVQSHA